MWDDHDYGANMPSVGRSAALTSRFKEYLPHPSRGPNATYRAFSIWAAKFVMLDVRSKSIPQCAAAEQGTVGLALGGSLRQGGATSCLC
mmetsp:Transcript_30663/g.59117  ORF Transcript_30663/g.59117 Transcript_30663/m.59117 type:complete len:89 (+) Transcript_30663:2044-2310(+)